MTQALYRVRAPFFKRNMVGLAICTAIPLGIYVYTWKMISGDDFADIPIPPMDDVELSKLQAEYAASKRK